MGGLVYGIRRVLGGSRSRHVLPDYVSIGRGTYGLDRNSFAGLSPDCPVSIGHYCSFGPEIMIFCKTDHRVDLPSTYPIRTLLSEPGKGNRDAITRGPITIGNDVWIGARAMILSGVTIGDGAVIGAGAVVSRDVAPFTVNAGVPARQIRNRFTPAQAAALAEIAWWNWPEERIKQQAELFYGDVDSFIAKARALA